MSPEAGLPREVVARFARSGVYREAGFAARAQALLAPDELETFAQLRHGPARRDYLAAHVLKRTMLADLAGCDPGRLCIRSSLWGRPEILEPPAARRFRFSMSHAGGIAVCAASAKYCVGADVESRQNLGSDPLELAQAVCSRDERHDLLWLPASERADYLLCIWTFKEAIAKAIGIGLRFPFDCLTVHWRDGCPSAVEFNSWPAADTSRWRLAWSHLTPDHVAAVAITEASDGHVAVPVADGLFLAEQAYS